MLHTIRKKRRGKLSVERGLGGGSIIQFHEVIRFGCSPGMLFRQALEDEAWLLAAYAGCCAIPQMEAMESFLPEEKALRREILSLLRSTHKVLNYNTPGYFQLDGDFNFCSDDPHVREKAYEAMCIQLSYAAEAESPVFVITGCRDQGEERRPLLKKRYEEFLLRLSEEAKQYPIRLLLEPIERHRFKRLVWGPTSECAELIRRVRAGGAKNTGLMIDIAHLPLMEERLETAIRDCAEIGFEHVHLGEAVLEEGNPFYGHTHPPLEIRGGVFSQKELEEQFAALIRCGYIRKGGARAGISLEAGAYPGASKETSIRLMYEKCVSAFYAAMEYTELQAD